MSGQRMIIMNAGSSYFEHVENYYGSNACEQNAAIEQGAAKSGTKYAG